jgi:hypothetical protein
MLYSNILRSRADSTLIYKISQEINPVITKDGQDGTIGIHFIRFSAIILFCFLVIYLSFIIVIYKISQEINP